MKKYKNSIFYIAVTGVFSALIYWTIQRGTSLEIGRAVMRAESDKTQWEEFLESLAHNVGHPLAILLAQIVTIILIARLFGWVCNKIGQPTVIGEIIAGIVLGPSLLGMYFPEFSAALFPVKSLGNLQFLSQIGLILFMFVIGMELDLKVLKNKAADAVVISHASIIIPFALGMLLAYFIYEQFAPPSIQFMSFGLFLGIAMSITAFPVLARIVQERGIHKTRLGTIVITCAAADDITAWCLLAAVIAIVKAGSFVSALYVIALAVGYVLLMILVVRPFLKRVGDLHTSREHLSKPIVAIFFLSLLVSSYATEIIGIHALFGAFMAGAIMPENTKFRNLFIEKVEDVALVLLLPLFFVFTGLRTQIGLLNDPYLWKVTGGIILVAVTGKFVGSALAAKYIGQTWKESLTIGALMNTRGLMELVVLNIGYDLGVLAPEIFAMMVIMALATTFMTGPALDLINWAFKSKSEVAPLAVASVAAKLKVLVSFGNPERGRSLVRLASGLTRQFKGYSAITAMHLSLSSQLNQFNIEEYEQESFAPVIEESKRLNQKVTTLFKPSHDIDADIADVANHGDYDLLLIGVGQSIFEGSLLGKILGFTTRIISPDRLLNQVTGKESLFENSPFDERTRVILSKTTVAVGILMDKGLESMERVFMPVVCEKDAFLLKYAEMCINSSNAKVAIGDTEGFIQKNPELKMAFARLQKNHPTKIETLPNNTFEKELLKKYDLMLVSTESWKKIVDGKALWLPDIPSTLILSEK